MASCRRATPWASAHVQQFGRADIDAGGGPRPGRGSPRGDRRTVRRVHDGVAAALALECGRIVGCLAPVRRLGRPAAPRPPHQRGQSARKAAVLARHKQADRNDRRCQAGLPSSGPGRRSAAACGRIPGGVLHSPGVRHGHARFGDAYSSAPPRSRLPPRVWVGFRAARSRDWRSPLGGHVRRVSSRTRAAQATTSPATIYDPKTPSAGPSFARWRSALVIRRTSHCWPKGSSATTTPGYNAAPQGERPRTLSGRHRKATGRRTPREEVVQASMQSLALLLDVAPAGGLSPPAFSTALGSGITSSTSGTSSALSTGS